MVQHTRQHYQEELAQLEERALGGLDLVITTLNRTLEAVEQADVELAEMVVLDDDKIDGRYLEVHQAILTLLATQAPVATDLRLISALLHLMKCVERMGDQCVNIAKVIPLSGHEPPSDERMTADIITMGHHVRSLITQCKRAFAERDVALARDLVRQDDVVDNLNREVFHRAIEIGDDHDLRDAARRPGTRADGRQRRRHRRADRLHRHWPFPGVRGRLPPRRSAAGNRRLGRSRSDTFPLVACGRYR
jgi:phosphate transport system protein